MIKETQNKAGIPEIVNSGKRSSTNQRMAILMTKLNSPRVKILKRKVIFLRKGLTKKLINPKVKPQNKKILIEPSNFTPGTTFRPNQRPKIATRI